MEKTFNDKTILVTGGCGSVGSEIVKQLLTFNPKVVRVLDHDEAGHFRLNQDISSPKIRNLIGDVRDKYRIKRAMRNVDIVFHAAALKHVPFCEYNPFEAVSTNVIGTQICVETAIEEGVEKFVGISTDKAVSPINTLGATKLLAEKIITNAPIGDVPIKFCCVRFGNVLNSVGSVIPMFLKQIQNGGPITITSKEMTRFFMSLPDSVRLVLKAAELVQGGETYIIKMEALRIIDLAEVLVEELAPRYAKDPKTIIYEIIGIRPGEKIHEGLMTEEEARYMGEDADMIILRNSLLAQHSYKNIIANGKFVYKDYNSATIPLLTKPKIKKILQRDGII